MLTGEQWSSDKQTPHGTGPQWIVICKSKGGHAMKLQTSLLPPPPLYFFIADLYKSQNDQIDHVKSRNPLKSGKFSSQFIGVYHWCMIRLIHQPNNSAQYAQLLISRTHLSYLIQLRAGLLFT